jgi:dTDP-4-amino-4,6-dideoxygalactose transaminase
MIPYGRHSINDSDIEAVVAALKSDWLTTGPLVDQFEDALEKVVGAPCIAVSSGTAALHCAYAAIDLQPGDEVITPPITFIATQATAALFGAKIVFADVQSDTANIDPEAVESAITARTKAIVAVDFAGHPADLEELRAIADKHGIYLIEDAAHSIGSTYRGMPVGSIADITTFSFFPTKNVTTAEGGAIASTHPQLLEKARKFSRQGIIHEPSDFKITSEGAWHREVHDFGLNYRLPDVLCALGISQLDRLDQFKVERNRIFDTYSSNLIESKDLRTPSKRSYTDPTWHLYPIKVDSNHRRQIFDKLRSHGIGVQVNYLPAHLHPVFASMDLKGKYPVSESFYESEISLPMSTILTNREQDFIIAKVNEIVKLCV